MWHLRRVHMESVGHPDARFDPLTIELTDEAGDPASSVLWLENMGGKTSWLSLVFSALRPALNDFLGKPDKQLGNYVLGNDTAHVILEFAQVEGIRTLTGTATRLVLGQVLQWRQRRQDLSRESSQLHRQLWAAVVPASGGAVTFDAVVGFIGTDDDRRRPLGDFVDRLTELMQGDVFRPDNNQTRWFEWLRNHGLDPEVFADQLKMSADEGSISERFHFQTGDQLVQWALPYIVPPEVPDGIASVIDRVRDTLAQRPSLVAQQQFCAVVGSRLAYAATQQLQLDDQRADATVIWDSSLALVDEVRAAVAATEAKVVHHRSRAAHFEQLAKDAQSRRNQRQQQWRQAQLTAARLRHVEAKAEHDDTDEKLREAKIRVDAWELTGPLTQLVDVYARLEQVEAQLEDVDDRAAPLRAAVTTAESRLAAKLTHLHDAANTALQEADGEIAAAESEATQATEDQAEAQAAHTAATADRADAEARLRHLEDEMLRAVQVGLIELGQTIDDAIVATDGEIERLAREIERLTMEAEAAEANVQATRQGLEAARRTEATTRADYEQAAARCVAVADAAERILASPLVASAFHTAHPDLWHDGPAAIEKLENTADAAATARVGIEQRSADDRRAVDWLDRTGLLPPSPDVERVLALLADEPGLEAYSGWDALRIQVPVDRQAEVIAAMPEIVNGVIVKDPDALQRAVEASRSLGLTAPTVLSEMALLHGRETEDGVVVLPGPAALYDETAGVQEADCRQQRLDGAEVEREEASTEEREAREARAALATFLQTNPSSEVARWQTKAAEHHEAHATAQQAVEQAERDLTTAEDAVRTANLAIQPARDAHNDSQRGATALEQLATSQSNRPKAVADLSNASTRLKIAATAMEGAMARRSTADSRLKSAVEDRSNAQARIDNHDNLMRRHHLTALRADPPADPLDSLETALDRARATLLAAAPPNMLVEEQKTLQEQRSKIETQLRRRNTTAVAMARVLLAGADGATPESRDRSTAASKEALAAAQGREALAQDSLKKAEFELRENEAVPQSRRAPLDKEPTTVGEALELVQRLSDEAAKALEQKDSADTQQQHHQRKADTGSTEARSFRREADDLTEVLRRHATLMRRPSDILDETRHAAPWPGTATQAEQHRRDRQVQLDEATEYMKIATDERNRALDDVRHLANEHRELLTSELPTLLPRLTDGDLDQRGAYSDDLASQLRAYALTIDNQLADIERHRRIVLDHLSGKVKETVKLLERMQRRTRLPTGLDDWSDRPFLHLTHPKLPDTADELTGRVATVVERICASPATTPTSGMDLLYAAVSAAVGGPFHATILKPHKRLTDERVDISEMASFSGGQKVTTALVMFAALTRMRTEARSRGHRTNAALPLLLDNPIGKANQATLMEVQQRVADSFGLQLIYTTGLHDLGALASFTNIVRLDGRENPRSGRVHVVVENRSTNAVHLDAIRLVQHDGTGQ